MVRLRCHEHECDQTLTAAIGNAMGLTGRRERDFSGSKFPDFATDRESALPFEHIVDLIFLVVRMSFLLLSGLEAIGVAEKSIGLKDTVLFHLVGRKLHRIR